LFICIPHFYKKNFNIFNPENYFFCWYFYYFGFGYICYQARVLMGISVAFDNSIVLQGFVFSIVVAIILKISLYYTNQNRINVIYLNKYLKRNNLSIIIILTLVNIILNIIFWYKIGGIPIFIPNYHNSAKADLGIGLGYIEYLNNCLTILLYLNVIVQWNIKRHFLVLALIFFNTFFLSLLSDSRSNLVFSLVNILMLYSWNIKKVKISILLVLMVLMAALASLWGALRDGVPFFYSGLIFLSEIAVEYDNYLDIINIFPSQVVFQQGKTLISCLTLLFPRVLMPNKNDFLTGGEFIKEIKNLDHIRVGVRMTLLGEMYMNFGFLGIILSAFILLFLLTLVKKFYLCSLSNKNYLSYLITFTLLSTANSFLAGDAATAFTFSFYNIAFLTLFLFTLFSAKKQPIEKMVL
jgi:hypothetical protein